MFLCYLSISVARTCKLLVGMVADPSFAKKSTTKDDFLSLQITLSHSSCSLLILLFIKGIYTPCIFRSNVRYKGCIVIYITKKVNFFYNSEQVTNGNVKFKQCNLQARFLTKSYSLH